MTSPFDDVTAEFYVLVNEEGQHSLWPVFVQVPAGWTVAFGARGHADCLEYIETNWTDMRPRSLVERMEQSSVS